MKKYGNQIRQTLLLSPDLREKLEVERTRTGASLSEVARRYIESGIDHEPLPTAQPVVSK